MNRPPWLTDDMVDRVCALGSSAGRYTLAHTFGITPYKAQVLLEYLKHAEPNRAEDDHRALRAEVKMLTAENEQLRVERSIGQRIAAAFAETVEALPTIKIPAPKIPKQDKLDPEDVILVLSDIHIGSVVSAQATGGLGHYDSTVFADRMKRLRSAVRSCIRYSPNARNRCWLILAGDLIEGETIFQGQLRQVDMPSVRQVVTAYESIAQLTVDLLETFERVDVITVPGNHGRLGRRDELAPADNLDWLAGYFLRERFSKEKRVRVHLPDTWWALVEVRGWKFLIAHGDEFRSWLGIPFYGAQRFKARMQELLAKSFRPDKNGGVVSFDFVITGHHHEIADFSGIYTNGSWVGGSEFSLKRLQSGGLPFQWLLGVHDTIGVSWARKLVLADRRQLPTAPIVQ